MMNVEILNYHPPRFMQTQWKGKHAFILDCYSGYHIYDHKHAFFQYISILLIKTTITDKLLVLALSINMSLEAFICCTINNQSTSCTLIVWNEIGLQRMIPRLTEDPARGTVTGYL